MRSLPFLLAGSALFGLGVSVFIARQTDPMFNASPGASLKAADLHANRSDKAPDEQTLVMLRTLQRAPKRSTPADLTLAEVEWLAADERQRALDAQTAAAADEELPESENDEFSDMAASEAVTALADQLQESGQASTQDITTTMALAEEAGVEPEALIQELSDREAAEAQEIDGEPASPAAENAASDEALPDAATPASAQPAAATGGL